MSLERPLIIAHRGCPGERLEHTVSSYTLAVDQGADFLEIDLVGTRDGDLVIRHENQISGTTNVAEHPEFADRRTEKIVDGKAIDGWFTEDFTVAELKTLRLRERLPKIRPQHDRRADADTMLTFDDFLELAAAINEGREKPIGLYIETKHPTYFSSLGISIDDLLLEGLERHGFADSEARVVIQSFETSNLKYLRSKTPHRIIQLMEWNKSPYDLVAAGDPRTYDDLQTSDELAAIAQYADGIGPHKRSIISRDSKGKLTSETGLAHRAHAAGLVVHAWTMRDENHFLPKNLRKGRKPSGIGDARAEYVRYFDAGVDGVFSDYTATAVRARADWLAGSVRRKSRWAVRG